MKFIAAMLALLWPVLGWCATCITGFTVETSAAMTGSPWTLVGNVPPLASTLTITPPAAHGTYWYRVTMHLSDGSQALSVPVSVAVLAVPASPLNLNLAQLFRLNSGDIQI